MIASRVTRDTLEKAAITVGVRLDMRSLNHAGTRWQVKVNPGPLPARVLTPAGYRRKGEKGDGKYQRLSTSSFHDQRRVHAVCWHGFRDFFRAVYELEPDAVFRTAMDTWRGSQDFEARYRESGHKNLGSQMYPRCAAEVCRCGEEGMAV